MHDGPSTSGYHHHDDASANGACARSRYRSRRVPGVGVFLLMDTAKQGARVGGKQVVDLSVGASDLSPPPEALAALKEAVDDASTHGYCLKSGTMPLLQAATAWYARRYGLQLAAECEALALIGAQEGLAHLLMAVADEGDGVLMTSIAYPSYFGAVQVAGLRPLYMPLDGDTFLPRFADIPEEHARAARVMVLNYPNNPTSAVATEAFFVQAIAYCKQHGLLLIHDNPYVDQVFDASHPAPSPLCLPGGIDCCVELFSFAKSYHLGGFRLGFALGNRDAITSLEALKAPIDFNQYRGIMRMGCACLQLPEERVRADAAVWRGRAQAMVQALTAHGWPGVQMPQAAMYLWLRLPAGAGDDVAFCQALVARTGVALSPGQGFGPGGRGFVRVALVQPEEVLAECAAHMAQQLKDVLAGAHA